MFLYLPEITTLKSVNNILHSLLICTCNPLEGINLAVIGKPLGRYKPFCNREESALENPNIGFYREMAVVSRRPFWNSMDGWLTSYLTVFEGDG